MNDHDFASKLAWSKGRNGSSDMETIKALIAGCTKVDEAPKELDLRGIDYVATLRKGATLNIDVKRREKGVSAHWKALPLLGIIAPEPELTLEYWSVVPMPRCPEGKVGWTLDESKLTDYVLYVFDRADSDEAFLLPFQLLRMTFRRHVSTWRAHNKIGVCESNGGTANGGWATESIFVPAWCVIEAIGAEMRRLLPSVSARAGGQEVNP